MRLSRWVRGANSRLLLWARDNRWASPFGEFEYVRRGESRRIRFDARNHQFHAIYEAKYREGYEPETSRLVSRLLSGAQGAFYDIGANWGYYSLLAAAVPGYEGEIHAFEPNPRVHRDLLSVVAQTGLETRVRAHAAGVGAVRGELVVEEADKFHTGLARLVAEGGGRRVPVVPLDEAGLADPVLIKIDAEGMEEPVLRGAARLLSRARPHIVFESHLSLSEPRTTTAPIELLLRSGYLCYMPVLVFKVDGREVHAAYGDDVADLLARQPDAPSALVPVDSRTRFFGRGLINVFACHGERRHELDAAGIPVIDATATNAVP